MNRTSSALAWAVTAVAAGALTGLLVGAADVAALGLAGVVVAAGLLARPRWALAASAICLPFVISLAVARVSVAVSDVLLGLAVVGWWLHRPARPRRADRAGVRLVVAALAGYGLVAVVDALVLHSAYALLTAGYRLAMLGLPLAAGVLFGRYPQLLGRLARIFVATCTLLALAWCVRFGAAVVWGVNKNPGGQMLVNAAILLLVQPKLRPWTGLVLFVLVAGVLATGSRGALLGLGAALVIVVVARFGDGRSWRRAVVVVVGAVGVLVVAPAAILQRLLAENDSGIYNLQIRGVFVADAWSQSLGHLGLGHGVGTYRPVDPALSRVVSLDPHNVFVLQIFEGGIPLLLAFVGLSLAPVVVLWRRRRQPLVLAALAAQFAVLTHCYVDIFWVRATPTFAWFLIGVALAGTAARPGRAAPPARKADAPVLAAVSA